MELLYGRSIAQEFAMPGYNLNGLGSGEFEKLSQALVKKVIGVGSVTFGAGRDGAREATYSGRAPYPSRSEQWKGEWIFQAKFHDTELLGMDKARRAVIADIDSELRKITEKYKHPCDNYIMITNVPLTSVPKSGTRERIEQEVFTKFGSKIKNLAVWGADDIARYLDLYPEIRTAFLHFIVAGDLIASLLKTQAQQADEVGKTIQAYLRTSFEREQYAQLDQAGDVADDPVRLQQVFFDLSAIHDPEHSRSQRLEIRTGTRWASGGRVQVVKMMLAEASTRVVLVGGPGEGKSTVGQYLAQLHRATLLQKGRDIALSPDYLPARPRIPFRVILKDYGQWLARQSGSDGGGSLDDYICEQVRAMAARKLEPTSLHKVIGNNPILLILDGLDEVTDADLKRILINRVVEFTERCQEIYDADMLVLATTRPTGYVEQFDPKNYLHLRLTKLETPQVIDYVERWTSAKQFDSAKALRVLDSIKECIADAQIRLMATTPLQVTILAVIVALGGTPPRQREALFNEYLEVIYKRETAKGKHIIQSTKERLIGLHKYVGYILHEKATGAEATSAYLDAKAYALAVSTFLTHQNPYAPDDETQAEHRSITKDAGDRLVLIVEPSQGRFGFELRSIQEFFAACHLLDTSKSTQQRYSRFEAISRLSHWRNVALFFAGRVGRNYEGEVANLVEVCRDIDREGPDRYLRRGAELALEMAADRPFGSNARGQRSLIEVGLQIFETDLSDSRRAEACDILQRLPPEDVRDHVLPLLRQKIDVLDPTRLANVVYAADSVGANSLIKAALSKLAAFEQSRIDFVRLLTELGLQHAPDSTSVSKICETVGFDGIESAIQGARWHQVEGLLEHIRVNSKERSTVSRLTAGVLARSSILGVSEPRETPIATPPHPSSLAPDSEAVDGDWWDKDSLSWPLPLTRQLNILLATISRDWQRDRRGRPASSADSVRRVENPPAVVDGNISGTFGELPGSAMLEAPLWVAHLWGGKVTSHSIRAAARYFSSIIYDAAIRNFIGRFRSPAPNPSLDILVSAIVASGTVPQDSFLNDILPYAGAEGSELWYQQSQQFVAELDERLHLAGRGRTISPSLLEQEFIAISQNSFLGENERASRGLSFSALGPNFSYRVLYRQFVEGFIRDGDLLSVHYPVIQVFAQDELRAKESALRGQIIDKFASGVRADSPEALSILLPLVLADGGADLSDQELLRLLGIVGRLNDHYIDYIEEGSSDLSSLGLERLIKVALATPPSDVMEGVVRVVRNYSFRFLYHVGRRVKVSRPRFKGFAAAHRELIRSRDQLARHCGILLLLAHPPASASDFEVVDEFATADLQLGLRSYLQGVVENSVLWHSTRSQWVKTLSVWLQRNLSSSSKAAVAEELDRLLAASNQSLSASEGILGLPLQD